MRLEKSSCQVRKGRGISGRLTLGCNLCAGLGMISHQSLASADLSPNLRSQTIDICFQIQILQFKDNGFEFLNAWNLAAPDSIY